MTWPGSPRSAWRSRLRGRSPRTSSCSSRTGRTCSRAPSPGRSRASGLDPARDPEAYGTALIVKVSTGETIGFQLIIPVGAVPVPFAVPYDPTTIDPNADYVARGSIWDGSTLWATTAGVPVITKDNARSNVILTVTAVPTPSPTAAPTPAPSPAVEPPPVGQRRREPPDPADPGPGRHRWRGGRGGLPQQEAGLRGRSGREPGTPPAPLPGVRLRVSSRARPATGRRRGRARARARA